MDQLVEDMKRLLATTFSFYLKAHNFHWNVEGQNFLDLHEFFKDIYEQVHGDVDAIAEETRALGSYVPGSYSRFSELTVINDETSIPAAYAMVAKLASDNTTLMAMQKKAYASAEAVGEMGLSNFLQDLYDKHKKMQWMLTSLNKGE